MIILIKKETMDHEIENEKVSPQVAQYMSSILTANRPDDDDDDDLLEDSYPQVVGVLCKKRQSGGSQDKNDALLEDSDEAAVDKNVNHKLNSVGLIAGIVEATLYAYFS